MSKKDIQTMHDEIHSDLSPVSFRPSDEFMTDAQGRLVHKTNVKEIDLLRDQLVNELFDEGRSVAEQVLAYKRAAFADILAFAELSHEKYGVKRGGHKGNITLTSFDGRRRITIARQENLQFTEQLAAAQQLILDCINSWTEGSRDEVRLLINDAFRTNKEGQVSTGKILGLLRLDIQDARWKTAMEAIRDSILVAGTSAYIRIHERKDARGKFRLIPLDGGTESDTDIPVCEGQEQQP